MGDREIILRIEWIILDKKETAHSILSFFFIALESIVTLREISLSSESTDVGIIALNTVEDSHCRTVGLKLCKGQPFHPTENETLAHLSIVRLNQSVGLISDSCASNSVYEETSRDVYADYLHP